MLYKYTKLLGLFLCVGLVSCGGGSDDDSTGDAGSDGSMSWDGGTDSSVADDTGTPDSGTDSGPEVSCTEGCNIVELAGGLYHTCARRENGQVLCWGSNYSGELGDGSTRHGDCTSSGDSEAVDCSFTPALAIQTDVAQISVRGGFNTCARTGDGHAYCWGLEINPPTEETFARLFEPVSVDLTDVAWITNGFHHACAVLSDGSVKCWGESGSGQLGYGETTRQVTPTEVVGVDGEGALAGIDEIYAGIGSSTTCAIDRDGPDTHVYCWGSDRSGQFGDGEAHTTCAMGLSTYDCSLIPVQTDPVPSVTSFALGGGHACAITDGDPYGTLYCWGANYHGQLGDGTTDQHETAIEVPGVTNPVQVVAGSSHTCVLQADGSVLCWGLDRDGETGNGEIDDDPTNCDYDSELVECTKSPTQVTGLEDATFLAAGADHTCAIRENGAVVCWGLNTRAQLGDGTRNAAFEPVTVQDLNQ